MPKSSEEFLPSLIPEQNSNCLNHDICEFRSSIRNELMQIMPTESTYCESDTDENNNSLRIDRILLDSRSPPEDEFLESCGRKDVKWNKDINDETLVCKFDNKCDLAGYDRLPTWIKCFETFEIQAVGKEDTVKYEKILNPIFDSHDNYLPALDSDQERKDYSKSLTKVQKLGVNPFQIGILINESDFLEHCRMVKNGSLKHCIKNSGASNHIEKERLQQYSKELELTVDEKSIVKSPVMETKIGHKVNEHEKASCIKFPSDENFTAKAREMHKDNQKVIDLSHSKSVSDLIEHFESNCDRNPRKKNRSCSRSIKRNKKTNYSEINRNVETETEIQTQYKRDCLENDLLSCSMRKVNDSFVYNVSDRSNQESSDVENQSELFALLEVFWFVVVMIIIFWHLIGV